MPILERSLLLLTGEPNRVIIRCVYEGNSSKLMLDQQQQKLLNCVQKEYTVTLLGCC